MFLLRDVVLVELAHVLRQLGHPLAADPALAAVRGGGGGVGRGILSAVCRLWNGQLNHWAIIQIGK